MKRIWILALAICLCLSAFTSCRNGDGPQGTQNPPAEPQNATELWTNITEAMNALNTYETDITGKISLKEPYGAGSSLSGDITMKSIVAGLKEGEYYDYSDIRVKTIGMKKDPSTGVPRVESKDGTNVMAFQDGQLYVMAKAEEGTEYPNRFRSALTKEEYIDFRGSQKKDLDSVAWASGSNVSFSKNEDGTWTLQASGYGKETVDSALASFAVMDRAAFEYDIGIKDMEVSVCADGNFRLTEIKVKFIFADANNTNSFEMNAAYSNYDTETPNTDKKIGENEFREIADIRLLSEFETLLKDFENRKSEAFIFDLDQRTTFSNYGDTLSQYYKETDTVVYGEENGKFFYDVGANTSLGDMKISYKNGEQTVNVFGIEQTAAQTEADAKAYINGFMQIIKYNSKHVYDLKEYAEGVYEIGLSSLYADLTDYDYLFEAYDGYADYINTLTMKITVKDGNIVKIENNVQAQGKYGEDNRSITINAVYTIILIK